MSGVNRNGKIKGNGVVAKPLFLTIVYKCSLLLSVILFIYSCTQIWT